MEPSKQELADAREKEERIWSCKIGGVVSLPRGADSPMRLAVARAFSELTGSIPEFIFSGWGAELTEPERAVVENRSPAPALRRDNERPLDRQPAWRRTLSK